MWDNIIEQIFSYAIVSSIIIIAMIIATLLFVRWALKETCFMFSFYLPWEEKL